MTDKVPSYNFAPWDVESLRLTTFHPERTAQPGLWSELMGNDPETVNSRPREQVLLEEGGANGNRLVVAYQNQRLDWTISPGPPSSPDLRKPVIMLDVDQAISLMRKALGVSTQSYHQVDRLAFGAILTRQVSDVAEGLRYLSQYLRHMDLENRGGMDFIYQVNRPRRSSHASHVSVNRLAKWSLGNVQTGSMRIGPSQPPHVAVSEFLLIDKLVLDINTVPTNNAISISRMPGLLDEFMAFAQEIAVTGDAS
jgi:hypothetical protein